MNADVEFHIRNNYPWSKLPVNVRQSLGNLQKEYEKAVFNFSVKNQLRHKGNLVRHVKKDEKRYYEELLRYSREHLMLYPYHLSDVIVRGLRVTPFSYYCSVMADIMAAEKSYDALPNFTAADCLRLLGIGRNQYIDLMNQCRSSKKFFRKKSVRELLPAQPVDSTLIEPWWVICHGYITEEDIKVCSVEEKQVIDVVIDNGRQMAADVNYDVLHGLYRKGLLYLDVPIEDGDFIVVPPLEGFVMNRVLGDYFETLLYKIFVSIDEHTTVAELANVLEIDQQLVKNAVSLYVRLGFAKKKGQDSASENLRPSWQHIGTAPTSKPPTEELLIDWTSTEIDAPVLHPDHSASPDSPCLVDPAADSTNLLNSTHCKRIAFLFDATLTAFLMMGNLSPGLKNHAVTMFEVGKLSDESLDSFLAELEKVDEVAEGEAQRYFDHALTLRSTIHFLRHSKALWAGEGDGVASGGHGLDLLRCESLLGLDPAICARVLKKNYSLLVSMAPLSNEIRPISSCVPQHLGPAIPEVNSVWFKLFLYHQTGSGPPSLLLVKGTVLRRLPRVFQDYDRLLVTTWGHDSSVIPTSNILLTLNDALSHSAILVQGHSLGHEDSKTRFVPFPFKRDRKCGVDLADDLENHPSVTCLASVLDLRHACGYVTLLSCRPPSGARRAGSAGSAGRGSRSASPRNGVASEACAAVLASEVDALVQVDSPAPASQTADQLTGDPLTGQAADRSRLTLDVGGVTRDGAAGAVAAGGDATLHWTLLDCCFGIPLFDAVVNRDVCERIASERLCDGASLQELLQSSRTLALNLLQFIADNQATSAAPEKCDMLPPGGGTGGQTVPLPTHSIMFGAGVLGRWDGR